MDERGIWIVGLVLVAAVLSVILVICRERKREKARIRAIEQLLAAFNDACVEERIQEALRPYTDNRRLQLETGKDDMDRILRQLLKLQNYMDTVREKAASEKEETRSIVTDIAHQLKNPVAVLDMSLSLLEDETLTREERQEFMGRFRASMNELETLMNSLIQISRMETGLIELNKRESPLMDTLMNSVNCLISRAEEKEISIELLDEEGITARAIAHDSKWLGEAFVNVFDNSLKYSPRGSVITIRPSLRNGFLRLEIVDQGIGIPKEERSMVLHRFYRGKGELVAGEKGSGIGLYLVDKIVRMHGGMVFIREGERTSQQYPGTCIVIQIPLQY